MRITREVRQDITLFKIEGEVTLHHALQLRRTFDAFAKEGHKKVVVDLSSLDYIDSSGLAALIQLHVATKKIGGVLNFCSLSENAQDVFEMAKLDTLFSTYKTVEDALTGF